MRARGNSPAAEGRAEVGVTEEDEAGCASKESGRPAGKFSIIILAAGVFVYARAFVLFNRFLLFSF